MIVARGSFFKNSGQPSWFLRVEEIFRGSQDLIQGQKILFLSLRIKVNLCRKFGRISLLLLSKFLQFLFDCGLHHLVCIWVTTGGL